jgi:hypothetical protein
MPIRPQWKEAQNATEGRLDEINQTLQAILITLQAVLVLLEKQSTPPPINNVEEPELFKNVTIKPNKKGK